MEERPVLIAVERGEDMRCLSDALEEGGINPYYAGTVGEALEFVRSHAPSVAISTLTFGGFQANEFPRLLRAASGRDGIRVLLIVSQVYTVEGIRRLNLGADEYLGAPIDPETLVNVVRGIQARCA